MQYFYLLKQGAITKVGITTRPKERKSQIKSDTGADFKVLFFARVPYAKEFETLLKRRYKHLKVTHKGKGDGKKVRGKDEWFKLSFFNRLKILFELSLILFLTYFLLSLIAIVFIYGLFKLI